MREFLGSVSFKPRAGNFLSATDFAQREKEIERKLEELRKSLESCQCSIESGNTHETATLTPSVLQMTDTSVIEKSSVSFSQSKARKI